MDRGFEIVVFLMGVAVCFFTAMARDFLEAEDEVFTFSLAWGTLSELEKKVKNKIKILRTKVHQFHLPLLLQFS